ncbi:MAG TPA: hypothetical protein ENK08_03725 [Chloroflexi bacterium]|nr:hypothetical protein [Chloroflexota bacterium]
MVETFWKEIGESLAGKWAARALAPAFAFWAGGLLAYVHKYGWKCLADWWTARSTPEQAAVLIGGLLGIVFSGLVMERFQDVVLRWAEGFWPRPLDRLRFALVRRWEKRARRMEERWHALAERCEGDPTRLPPKERAEYARLDGFRLRLPFDPGRMMPTLVGNVLRAAEEHPQVRYGLAAGVCWPRLWLLLPKEAREEIGNARERLDESARLLGWGLLFVVWTAWAWWAAPVGLLVAFLACRWMVMAALVYGDLVRAAFDLHRHELYRRLGWSMPEGEDEVEQGRRLTEYLARGTRH